MNSQDDPTQIAAQNSASEVKFNGSEPTAMQLRNCASWHIDRVDEAVRRNDLAAADRHDRIAFRLLMQARALS